MQPGSTIAHYTVVDRIGAGGMGEVYRAHDTKLGRDVALKILPPAFAQDADRLARFEREARTLAQLQHPHIASIYGFEQLGDQRCLVMELAEGQDLADRIRSGPLALGEALAIARQIAQGLEAAHDKGIVHRDLKPANIRVAPDGGVKILDFGLAKAWSGETAAVDLSSSPTLTAAATLEGVVLGTAGYMSPEQARGHAVDRRTDIWAFGVILWEMLTGRQLFEGDTVSDVMAGVLRGEIDLAALPAATPAALGRLLRRCLERDRKSRLRDIGDALLELDEADGPAAPDGGAPRRPRRAAWPAIVAVAVAAAVLTTWLATRGGSSGAAAVAVPAFEQKTFGAQVIFNARFLPDGEGIVYSSASYGNVPRLMLLARATTAPREIGPEGTHLLAVSGTGELAVLTGARFLNHRVLQGTLARMEVDGGPRALLENVRDAAWGPDGELAVVRRVGGVDRLEYPLGTLLYETSGYVSDPRVSPDGKHVAFLDHQWWLDDRGWLKMVDAAGKVTTLSSESWAAQGVVWTPDGGHILFSGVGADDVKLSVMAVDLADGRTRGILGAPDQVTVVDVDAAGRLLVLNEQSTYGVVAQPRGADQGIDLTWLDACWGPRLAPDGKTVIFCNGRGGPNYTVVSRTVDGSPLTTLGEGNFQDLSPDGAWVAAQIATPPGIALYPIGPGAARHLDPGPIVQFHRAQWFPDSRSLLITGNERGGPVRCYRQSIDGGPPEPLTIAGPEAFGLMNLDGTAVLGMTGESTWSLYPLAGGEPVPMPALQTDDEIEAWNRDGTALYVMARRAVPCTLTRVDLATQARTPGFTFGPAREPGLLWLSINGPVFDPTDGFAYGYLKRLSQVFVVTGAQTGGER